MGVWMRPVGPLWSEEGVEEETWVGFDERNELLVKEMLHTLLRFSCRTCNEGIYIQAAEQLVLIHGA